ncbi:hypothetical protein SAMN05216191_11992 [Paenibacillus jilunlii]|uniref:Uncharacterized protein n=1 Tax=Paenibacillus jilunlii TaxID=682956 RepID=A0A1G9WIP7_9BACL|nr:hypothetical protein SAMN05216191_11992 [Paenibacillus jilunlii]
MERGQALSQKPFLFLYNGGDNMSWSKLKQQLEGFLSPAFGNQECPDIQIPISNDDIETVRKAARGTCRRIA